MGKSRRSYLPGEEVVALAGLNAPCAPPPLTRIRQADPLGRQRRQIRLQVKIGDLDLAAVHHEDNVVDGDGGLGDVGGQDDLAGAGRRPLENGPLGGRRHEAVHRVYHHRTR
jgi:hypothetical protein